MKRTVAFRALYGSATGHWAAARDGEFRVVVQSGGFAPVGGSGAEAASILGSIYRNLWIGNHPRPASLGSALQ